MDSKIKRMRKDLRLINEVLRTLTGSQFQSENKTIVKYRTNDTWKK